jgi:hypothetical protein
MEWISVKDRLPKRPTEMVIVYVTREYSGPYLYIAQFKEGHWDVHHHSVDGITSKVTHWMPLPEAPKG